MWTILVCLHTNNACQVDHGVYERANRCLFVYVGANANAFAYFCATCV